MCNKNFTNAINEVVVELVSKATRTRFWRQPMEPKIHDIHDLPSRKGCRYLRIYGRLTLLASTLEVYWHKMATNMSAIIQIAQAPSCCWWTSSSFLMFKERSEKSLRCLRWARTAVACLYGYKKIWSEGRVFVGSVGLFIETSVGCFL